MISLAVVALVAEHGLEHWQQILSISVQALERAEGVSGAKHPRIIPTLIHLGEVYAHTQRVTLAEGLYRQAVGTINPSPASTFHLWQI